MRRALRAPVEAPAAEAEAVRGLYRGKQAADAADAAAAVVRVEAVVEWRRWRRRG